MATFDPITAARFWSKVEVRGESECWPWRGNIIQPSGYGRFQGERAHRVAFRFFHGSAEPELLARHLCHNKRCCNPRHLALGTPADNAADDLRDGRTVRGERHGRSKLTADQVSYIRTSQARGIDLARELGVSESTISEVRSFRVRRHG